MTPTTRIFLTGLVALSCCCSVAMAELPAPKWVEMIEQGASDRRLKGLEAPRGVKVEIVKEVPGVQEREILLVHEGWSYLAGGGGLIRRRPHEAASLDTYQAAVQSKLGPPTVVSSDSKWTEQQILRGLGDKPGERMGGLTLGLDCWLYLSIGGTSNKPEGWDGSQVSVLGSGAVFRLRPDGSHVQEFARGFAQPSGPPMCDALGVIYQADRTPQGSRLIHVLAVGDYGWRSDLDPPQLDRPGTLPAMLTSKDREPGRGVVYSGRAFPSFLQRLVIIPAADAHAVRALALEPNGVTLAIREQFDLVRSDKGGFQPIQVIVDPEGAIYVVEKAGRTLRLSWSGTNDVPAIELMPSPDPPAPAEPPSRDELLAIALDEIRPIPARAAALAAACGRWNDATQEACLKLLGLKDPDLQRLAADALGDHLPEDKEIQQQIAGIMQQHLLSASLPARRSLYIALGKLGTRLETVPEWIFEASSVTPDVHKNRHLFDGHVRAVEMPEGWATELLIGNLEVALFDPNPEPEERVRLKKFVVATAEAMRTRELADFLERVIRDDKDYFSKLEGPLQVRLLAAWQNVLVEPPVHADAVAQWLEKHPAAAAEVRQAAWHALAKVGTAKPDGISRLAGQMAKTKIDPTLQPLVVQALERHVIAGKPGDVDRLLAELKNR